MPVHGLPVVEVDTGTVSKGSMEIQEVVHQGKAVLQAVLLEVLQEVRQGVHRDRQDHRELRSLQEALGSETVEVLQTGSQEGQGCREAWVHVEETTWALRWGSTRWWKVKVVIIGVSGRWCAIGWSRGPCGRRCLVRRVFV